MQTYNSTNSGSVTMISNGDALIANRPLDLLSANSTPAPTPKAFTPGRFIRLADGSLRPLTQEEANRPDIDWPYCVEFPYKQYRRTCIHCKGELWCRDLGHSITNYKGGLSRANFAAIVCENGCKDPVRFTARELAVIEWLENNSQNVFYTPEEIEEWDAGIDEIKRRISAMRANRESQENQGGNNNVK